MTEELLTKLEQKVTHTIEIIEFMRLQIEDLEKENQSLKQEKEQWRDKLAKLINSFDNAMAPAAIE